MDEIRLKKIATSYQQEIANMLLLEVKDPRLSGVHVNHVRITPDLRLARIYFNMDGGRSREGEVLKGFKRSKGFIKKELAARIKLRYNPDLEFFYDEAEDLERKVEDIFRQLENEKNHI